MHIWERCRRAGPQRKGIRGDVIAFPSYCAWSLWGRWELESLGAWGMTAWALQSDCVLQHFLYPALALDAWGS